MIGKLISDRAKAPAKTTKKTPAKKTPVVPYIPATFQCGTLARNNRLYRR